MDLEHYLKLVAEAAALSKDTGAQIGAVLIDRHGNTLLSRCNEFPIGVIETAKRRSRPAKYIFTEHAERNVIFAAARKGYALEGATIVQNWYPCADCARAIVQSGICRVYCEEPNFLDPRWGEAFRAARSIFDECGIRVEFYRPSRKST